MRFIFSYTCDTHFAEIKNFYAIQNVSFEKPGPSASSLLTTKLTTIESRGVWNQLPPTVAITYSGDCLRNVTPANASLYRASYYKLWRNRRARNDNTKKRLLDGLPQRVVMQSAREKCIARTNPRLYQTDYPAATDYSLDCCTTRLNFVATSIATI